MKALMKNLLYIHTHDSGRYISPYGYAVPTPNLQRLAEQSLLFRHAFCAAPTCSPSRAAMLTGTSAHSSGMLGLAHRGFKMKEARRHLSFFLKENGYNTALAGIQHEAGRREDLGYEKFLGKKKLSADYDEQNAAAAAEFICRYKAEKPFFLSVGIHNTHREYPTATGEINPDYVMPPYPIPDNAENRLDTARYMRSAQIADNCVGTVLEALDKAGLTENTVVLFTTDHGIAMPFMKCNLSDAGIGVAMMIRALGYPGMEKATDSLVSHTDVFPTLCDLLCIPKPEWLQGVSMLPVLNDPKAKIREEIFSEVTYHAAYEPMRCVRTENYKLIKYYGDYDLSVPCNIDDSIPKRQMLDAGLAERRHPKEMLFDLRFDPAERVNLIGEKEYAEIYADLSERLINWQKQTKDPLLEYPCRIPAPKGAIVNTRECLQPYFPEYE